MPAPAKADSSAGAGALGLLVVWVRRWPWEMPLAALVERLGGLASTILSATAFAAINFLAIISVEAEKPPPGGWVPSVELSGQGVACVVSGMAGSAPAGGSLSRSMVAGLTGAASPLMGLVCGVCTLLLAIPQVASLLAPTPKAVLAAICLAAVLPTVLRPKDVLKLQGPIGSMHLAGRGEDARDAAAGVF
ncbi:unnamed protein product [Prorocentrum cordatum]|uniref:SLC26A/SulP transporter domain-containing protein n=1 Tax=Prorocentrum cordatum TaxID=2364126 RepID=A0ABN9PCB6_9DINO|nr:unnamed protein product [Polarella glacialis]